MPGVLFRGRGRGGPGGGNIRDQVQDIPLPEWPSAPAPTVEPGALAAQYAPTQEDIYGYLGGELETPAESARTGLSGLLSSGAVQRGQPGYGNAAMQAAGQAQRGRQEMITGARNTLTERNIGIDQFNQQMSLAERQAQFQAELSNAQFQLQRILASTELTMNDKYQQIAAYLQYIQSLGPWATGNLYDDFAGRFGYASPQGPVGMGENVYGY